MEREQVKLTEIALITMGLQVDILPLSVSENGNNTLDFCLLLLLL